MATPDTTATYNHVFTLAFSMNSSTHDGHDIPASAFRPALQRRLDELAHDEELANAVFPPDETELRTADGDVTTIKAMPFYSEPEISAALAVRDYLHELTRQGAVKANAWLAVVKLCLGEAEFRDKAVSIACHCLAVHALLPDDIKQAHAFDADIIPAIIDATGFDAEACPKQAPEDLVDAVIHALRTPPIPPAQPRLEDIQDENDETVTSEFDICCPSCGSDEHMQVQITVLADLSADGTDAVGDHDWDDSSFIRCDACGWQGRVHQCRADTIAAAKADRPAAPGKRIMAEFVPQAWLNDHAIAVDPTGDTMFDVTDHILALGRATALSFRDGTTDADDLRQLPTAPQWAKEWTGPFAVNVEEAIADYYAALDAADPQTNESAHQ